MSYFWLNTEDVKTFGKLLWLCRYKQLVNCQYQLLPQTPNKVIVGPSINTWLSCDLTEQNGVQISRDFLIQFYCQDLLIILVSNLISVSYCFQDLIAFMLEEEVNIRSTATDVLDHPWLSVSLLKCIKEFSYEYSGLWIHFREYAIA